MTHGTAHELAQKMKSLPYVKDAYVDDYHEYTDYTDYQVVVLLEVHKGGGAFGNLYWPDTDYEKFNLSETSRGIKRILKDKYVSKFGKGVSCPKRIYRWNGYKSEFAGYEKNYIMVDFVA